MGETCGWYLVLVYFSYPSSTKDAFKLSKGAWDRDRVVITSSKNPTNNLRSSSCKHIDIYIPHRMWFPPHFKMNKNIALNKNTVHYNFTNIA